ncbi:MAG: hypothetical protein ACI906_002238 [Candidatus Latescibacterota bacterium]|jgi:hypothetical protein
MADPLQFGGWVSPGYSYSGLIDGIGLFDEALTERYPGHHKQWAGREHHGGRSDVVGAGKDGH